MVLRTFKFVSPCEISRFPSEGWDSLPLVWRTSCAIRPANTAGEVKPGGRRIGSARPPVSAK